MSQPISEPLKPSRKQFASLDARGCKRDLPIPFRPTRRLVTREDFSQVIRCPPFRTLPRLLIPTPNAPLQPPVMHYGWPVNKRLLWSYAQERGLVHYFSTEEPMGSDDDEDEFEGLNLEENKHEYENHGDDGELKTDPNVNLCHTLNIALRALAKELGLSWPRSLLYIQCALQVHAPIIVSVYSNYDLLKVPSDEDVETLRKRLDAPALQWYMEDMNATWTADGPRW